MPFGVVSLPSAQSTLEADSTSTAMIEVTEPDGTVTAVPNITSYSYSSDALQIGDPFAVTVPDPRLRYVAGKLKEGSRITFSLQSPKVAGGAATKKRTGVIVKREVSASDSGGTTIQLTGADIGWHLANCDGPPWFGLQGCEFDTLATAMIHPDRIFSGMEDPGWGFADKVRYENVNNRLHKQAVPQGRQGIVLANQAAALTKLYRIQVEPGEKLWDVFESYLKRLILFANVTAEGELVVYLPDYKQGPSYHFYCYPQSDSRRNTNNVKAEGIRRSDDVTERWGGVMCFGEVPLPDLIDQTVAQDNINANKFHADIDVKKNTEVAGGLFTPPFFHLSTSTDGEALYGDLAKARATWRRNMGFFNSHVITFTVRGHHQGGKWYEPDTLCTVDFPVVGIGPTTYYVTAVRCDNDDSGERTQITCHVPGLLGEIGV